MAESEEAVIRLPANDKNKKRDVKKVYPPYIKSLLTKKVVLAITEVGKNIKQNLEDKIVSVMEGKCIEEGFIRPNSVRVISYSCGIINTENIEFQTVFECYVCHPVEGMEILCTVKTITKAGIHAEYIDVNDVVPIVVFVAREHHFNDRFFADVKESSKIKIRVIGIRYELNDTQICVIGKLLQE
jgi:DNA-directed RNA polymerase subunit E'/Rpb7